jgi:hypothetical protein
VTAAVKQTSGLILIANQRVRHGFNQSYGRETECFSRIRRVASRSGKRLGSDGQQFRLAGAGAPSKGFSRPLTQTYQLVAEDPHAPPCARTREPAPVTAREAPGTLVLKTASVASRPPKRLDRHGGRRIYLDGPPFSSRYLCTAPSLKSEAWNFSSKPSAGFCRAA